MFVNASAAPKQHEAGSDETHWKWLICSTESSRHPRGKLIIFIPAGALMPLPLPQRQTFAHQIQLTQAQSERLCMFQSWRWGKGELQVDHWHLRSQSWMLEPSNLPRLDWMWDLCDKLPEDVSIPGCHGSRPGDGHCATWQRHLHIGCSNVFLQARRSSNTSCPHSLQTVAVQHYTPGWHQRKHSSSLKIRCGVAAQIIQLIKMIPRNEELSLKERKVEKQQSNCTLVRNSLFIYSTFLVSLAT